MKIVSGGQTGVDRAALDAALELGVLASGWCPAGRLAEDGVIPTKYPLVELPDGGYRERTVQNVIDSDGTAIIYFGQPHGGTALTLSLCMEHKRPYLLIDGERNAPEQAAHKLFAFIQENGIGTLNVAGPRQSGDSRAYPYAREVISALLRDQHR